METGRMIRIQTTGQAGLCQIYSWGRRFKKNHVLGGIDVTPDTSEQKCQILENATSGLIWTLKTSVVIDTSSTGCFWGSSFLATAFDASAAGFSSAVTEAVWTGTFRPVRSGFRIFSLFSCVKIRDLPPLYTCQLSQRKKSETARISDDVSTFFGFHNLLFKYLCHHFSMMNYRAQPDFLAGTGSTPPGCKG